jgi:hypothetical protein
MGNARADPYDTKAGGMAQKAKGAGFLMRSRSFLYVCVCAEALLSVTFVRNGKLLASLCAACCQYTAAIGSQHALTETVLIVSFTVVRLKCPFHLYPISLLLFSDFVTSCKITNFF